MYLPTTAALLLTTAVAACMGKPHHHFKAEPVKAVAAFNGMNNVTGSIQFVQDSPHSPTYIIANLTGVPAGEHGLHIHQLGDLTNGCLSTGPHYNPWNKTHGAPDAENKHVGDFGNIVANADGTAFLNITSQSVQLGGPYSVVGRGIVLHAGVDDLGLGGTPLSNSTGNAGDRLACGIIGYATA